MNQSSRSRPRRLALGVLAFGLAASACASADTDDGAADTIAQTESSSAETTPAAPSATDVPNTPGTDATTSAGTSAAPEATTAATPDPVVVPEALQFTAPFVGGGEFVGAEFADKPTLFWFWAPT